MAQPIPVPTSNWLCDIRDLKLSSMEFYNAVETAITNRQLPKGKASRITLSQGGMFSSNREYLRVSNGDLTFDICAAPYGTGFFVSWWFGERIGFIRSLLYRIPVLGPFLVKISQYKTYYQLDTEGMWREAVRSCVNQALEDVTTAKGIRGLSDVQLQVQAGQKK